MGWFSGPFGFHKNRFLKEIAKPPLIYLVRVIGPAGGPDQFEEQNYLDEHFDDSYTSGSRPTIFLNT